jgi:predicted N-acetyltransferase YhbS
MRSALLSRALTRDEIADVWKIDRSEVIENIYRFRNGKLVLEPHHFDVTGWPPGEAEKYTPLLIDCFDRGGWFQGFFAPPSIVGVAILDPKPLGARADRLQLKFLHVSHAWRKHGLGTQLFEQAKAEARRRGARQLYISATESQNTVEFYLGLGCVLTNEIDPDLFALEPKDLHLECDLTA